MQNFYIITFSPLKKGNLEIFIFLCISLRCSPRNLDIHWSFNRILITIKKEFRICCHRIVTMRFYRRVQTSSLFKGHYIVNCFFWKRRKLSIYRWYCTGEWERNGDKGWKGYSKFQKENKMQTFYFWLNTLR